MSFDLPLSMIVELTLTALLAATLICCISLDRRLKRLRQDQHSLNGTVQALNAAVINAAASIAKLRTAATEADKSLGGKVSSARALVDELSLLTAACERIATRMEDASGFAPRSRPETLRAVR
jgi:chromosome segregation ATPase